MTATTTAPASGQTVSVLGFELHFSGRGRRGEDSNKFWAAAAAGSTVLVHHGRAGTAGSYFVKRFGTDAQARAYLLERTESKERSTGYWMTRDAVRFSVDASLVARAGSTSSSHEQGDPAATAEIMRQFRSVSDLAAR